MTVYQRVVIIAAVCLCRWHYDVIRCSVYDKRHETKVYR